MIVDWVVDSATHIFWAVSITVSGGNSSRLIGLFWSGLLFMGFFWNIGWEDGTSGVTSFFVQRECCVGDIPFVFCTDGVGFLICGVGAEGSEAGFFQSSESSSAKKLSDIIQRDNKINRWKYEKKDFHTMRNMSH